MHSLFYEQRRAEIEQLRLAFAALPDSQYAIVPQPVIPQTYVAAGQPIFSGHEIQERPYLITSGEALILRDGYPIDLVEEGELLDQAMWPETTIVALSGCTFVQLPMVLHELT